MLLHAGMHIAGCSIKLNHTVKISEMWLVLAGLQGDGAGAAAGVLPQHQEAASQCNLTMHEHHF